MGIKSLKTSIFMTNTGFKKKIRIENIDIDGVARFSNNVEVDNELEYSIIQHFLKLKIISIRHLRVSVGKDNFEEYIEIINSAHSNLSIRTDDSNKYFNDFLYYVDQKFICDLLSVFSFDKIIFKLDEKINHRNITTNNEDGKTILYCNIPCTLDGERNKVITEQNLTFIQECINNYFLISDADLKCTFEDGSFEYLTSFHMYTNKAEIIIGDKDIYYGLELYFGMIKKELELDWLRKRDEDFKKFQKCYNVPLTVVRTEGGEESCKKKVKKPAGTNNDDNNDDNK